MLFRGQTILPTSPFELLVGGNSAACQRWASPSYGTLAEYGAALAVLPRVNTIGVGFELSVRASALSNSGELELELELQEQ
jgi:hypothetical protein